MVLERIANPSLGESRVLSSSLSRSAIFLTRENQMKPGKTFKLRKPTKTMLASITDPVKRNEWKHAMIQAQLASEVVVKREPRNDNKGASRGPGTGYTNTATSATPNA